jgi:hypothetical protein
LGSAFEAAAIVMRRCGGIIVAGVQGLCVFGRFALRPRHIPPNGAEAPFLNFPRDQPNARLIRDLAGRLSKSRISVHLFGFVNGQSPDIAVMGVPAALTSGFVHLYNSENISELHGDLFAALTTDYLWGALLQIRASSQLKSGRFHGNFTLTKQGKCITFPVLDPREAACLEVTIGEPIKDRSLFIQVALVWTNSARKRMIRVASHVIPVSSFVPQIHRSVDELSLAVLIAKRTLSSLMSRGAAEAALRLKAQFQRMLKRGLPMTTMLHLSHALTVSRIFAPVHPMGPDGRVMDVLRTRGLSPTDLLIWIYPRMFCVDSDQGPLPLVTDSFATGAVFLFHLIDKIIIWVSEQCSPEYLADAFGVTSVEELDGELPTIESAENQALRDRCQQCWELSQRYLPVVVIGQGDPREAVMSGLLVDTQPANPVAALDVWIRELVRV